MFTQSHQHEAPALLTDSTNVDGLRAQRVWQLVNVGWFTWFAFMLFCFWRHQYDASTICAAETVAVWSILYLHRRRTHFRRIMNLSLGACGLGIVLVSGTHPELHRTMFFFPVSIVIASNLLGVRAAFHWLVTTLIVDILFFVWQFGLSGIGARPHFDALVLTMGVAICIFFCCQQAEEFFYKRTQSLVDISQKLSRKAKRLHYLATTDSLTGLLNRFQFQKELHKCVDRAQSDGDSFTLVMIDMDGFKEINDTLGHPIGDKALLAVAHRLRDEFGGSSYISRLGGDEFCLICPSVQTTEQSIETAKRVGELLAQRCVVDDCDFPLGASVGTAICPQDSKTANELLAFADTAMFHAKEGQLGFSTYAAEMTDRLVEYRKTQQQLSVALENNEFSLAYQPQVNLATGKVIGVEALLRWHRDGEAIPPIRFIPLLERSQEIIPVGRWVIRESCRQLREWQDAGLEIEVSLNLSAVQFKDDMLGSLVRETTKEFGVDPRWLDFEITESFLIDDVEQAVQRLKRLKALGSSISIDDFGTGYSSLAYLRQFPLDRLKIDRTFVKDIPSRDDGMIASSIAALAKSLNLKVLAEGVETPEQLEFLKSFQCDEYQGFYFCRPVPSSEIYNYIGSSPVNTP